MTCCIGIRGLGRSVQVEGKVGGGCGLAQEFGPGGDEGVVGEGLGCAFLRSQMWKRRYARFARGVVACAGAPQEGGGGLLASGHQGMAQMVCGLPDGPAAIGGGIPVFVELVGAEQAALVALLPQDARLDEAPLWRCSWPCTACRPSPAGPVS